MTHVSSEARPVARPSLGVALALAALSAVLCVAASPPFDVWPLAFASWAPLLVALRRRSPRQALLLGGARELVFNLLALGWVPALVRTFGDVPWAVCWAIALAFFAYGAGRTALMAWVLARAERNGWPVGLALVLALAATEAFYPLLFPWYSAVQVHSSPVLMQLAEVGGPVLVGVPLAMASVAIAEVAWARLDARPIDRARVAFALAGPAFMVAFGVVRVRQVERAIAAAPEVEVAFVQGNAPHEGLPLAEAIALHRDATVRMLAERGGRPLDLVVWPEDAVNGAIATESIEPLLRSVTTRPDGITLFSTPLLTGTTLRRGGAFRNAAVLFAGDAVRGVYDKQHPLAFGEMLPFGDALPALHRWLPNAGQITAGTAPGRLRLGDHTIAPLICYEDILASEANRAIAEVDPDLLVNLTNDAWFGGSTAAGAHLALAQFRAVEHRRFLVHATNSGASAFVDPTGRATAPTPMLEATTRRATLRWMRARTAYERVGDAPWWCAALLAGAMAFVRRAAIRDRLDRHWPSTARSARSGAPAIPG